MKSFKERRTEAAIVFSKDWEHIDVRAECFEAYSALYCGFQNGAKFGYQEGKKDALNSLKIKIDERPNDPGCQVVDALLNELDAVSEVDAFKWQLAKERAEKKELLNALDVRRTIIAELGLNLFDVSAKAQAMEEALDEISRKPHWQYAIGCIQIACKTLEKWRGKE